MKLVPWQKRSLHALWLLLWISGAAWLYLQFFGSGGAFGSHPAQPLWMKLHGAAAMGFMILVGSLLPEHVRRGWRRRRWRLSGSSMLSVSGLLIASGWGLYYFSDEALRHATSVFHWCLGLIFPIFLFVHILKKKKSSKF